MHCPCRSNRLYSECCEPYLQGKAFPQTAEALMRSRYTAYSNVTEKINKICRKTLINFAPFQLAIRPGDSANSISALINR